MFKSSCAGFIYNKIYIWFNFFFLYRQLSWEKSQLENFFQTESKNKTRISMQVNFHNILKDYKYKLAAILLHTFNNATKLATHTLHKYEVYAWWFKICCTILNNTKTHIGIFFWIFQNSRNFEAFFCRAHILILWRVLCFSWCYVPPAVSIL